MSAELDSPQAVQAKLTAIERDMATRQPTYEDAARKWFEAKRDKEKARATAFLSATGTVAQRQAIADRDTALDGKEDEALWESLKAVMRTLEARASVLQSVLRAQSHV